MNSANKDTRYSDLFMDIADRFSKMSHAVRLKVGCLLVKDGNIISFSWNGMPTGWDNNCETAKWMDGDAGGWLAPEEIIANWPLEGTCTHSDGETFTSRYKLVTKPEVLHAEANCLMKLAKTTISSEGSTMFCTHAPCMDCAKLIFQAGVRKLIYRDSYRNDDGVAFLAKSNIEVKKVT